MSILIAILNTGWIRSEFLIKIQEFTEYPAKKTFIVPTKAPQEHNRNWIVKKCLEGKFDYLLMIDSDNPPIGNPLDLVDKGLDVVGFPYLMFNGETFDWVCGNKVKNGYKMYKEKGVGLEEVDVVGSGCILIKKEVLENVKAPFMRKWDEDGLEELGLDLYFCEKAKQAGFKIWIAWDYLCSHFKEIDLLNVNRES